ncbi:MAG: T9SS type A sorting domain-containing protein [Bacteroidales bacterium]|nr:T9SS type A sorting domain-containing protein [Bacteroidales bacterium]
MKRQIIDGKSQEVQTLVDEFQHTGNHNANLNGLGIPPGIYFCILKTIEGVRTEKLIKL